jgi:hypothetical protein
MLAALDGVLRDSWHLGPVSSEEYRLAVDVEPVQGESESGGRDLSAGKTFLAFIAPCGSAALRAAWPRV